MFGYVKIHKPEMKIREYEAFKAYYCGLCKTMGKNHNQLSRMGLNYDFTFLAILLSSMENEKDRVVKSGCLIKKFGRKKVVEENRSLAYTSDLSIMLLYYKLLDDWKDDISLKALLAALPLALPTRRVEKKYYRQFKAIEEGLSSLSSLEQGRCNMVDKVADTFGELMAQIVVPDFIEGKDTRRILANLGYHMGRWIYILDAFDDLARDIKADNYNPIISQYGYKKGDSLDSFKKDILARIEFSLTMSLDMVSKSLELLDIRQNKGILDNIVYLGMRSEMDKVLFIKGGNSFERSI